MKIDIIGSGAIFTKYNSASYLIDNQILLDIPNGTCKKLMNMNKNIHEIYNIKWYKIKIKNFSHGNLVVTLDSV